MDIGKMLKGHDLFKSFLPDQVEALSRFCSTKTLEKGQTVYDADRKATHVFVLLDGQIHLRFPGGTGEVGPLVSRIGKGELFGHRTPARQRSLHDPRAVRHGGQGALRRGAPASRPAQDQSRSSATR